MLVQKQRLADEQAAQCRKDTVEAGVLCGARAERGQDIAASTLQFRVVESATITCRARLRLQDMFWPSLPPKMRAQRGEVESGGSNVRAPLGPPLESDH
ncbi:hypothetical protein HaLaN_11547 [Haematococcus lacustris]|uniref:Uncharacterized protein n=1 Tax=Haematococcus lacustris TaxID=44745 RepID=A0A699Z7Y0_HAELA|nr:hypothetical protein HaLaN_11547 [Haematococcus lacustris]